MTDAIPPFLERRPFEEGFLKGAVFSLTDAAMAAEAVDEARRTEAVLISCRIPVGQGGKLARAGFRRIEELVTYARACDALPEVTETDVTTIRMASLGDIPVCRSIAENALRADRFHADPTIPNGVADALKAAWIENSIRGRATAVLLAETDGAVTGFNAVNITGDEAAIDLIAVAADQQGRGLGRALVAASLQAFEGRCRLMRVGTQDGNGAACRLYSGMGFEEVGRAETWHWTPPGA